RPAAAEGLEVGARTEGAVRSRQDGDGEALVGLETAQGFAEGRGRRAVHGVARLGAIEGDDRNGTVGRIVNRHAKPPRKIRLGNENVTSRRASRACRMW